VRAVEIECQVVRPASQAENRQAAKKEPACVGCINDLRTPKSRLHTSCPSILPQRPPRGCQPCSAASAYEHDSIETTAVTISLLVSQVMRSFLSSQYTEADFITEHAVDFPSSGFFKHFEDLSAIRAHENIIRARDSLLHALAQAPE
jgi:hypothetical protein